MASGADLVLTNAEMAAEFEDFPVPVRIVRDFMNVDEIARIISELVNG